MNPLGAAAQPSRPVGCAGVQQKGGLSIRCIGRIHPHAALSTSVVFPMGTKGPFSVEQGRELVAALGIPADVRTSAHYSDDPEGFKRRLLAGRTQIVLHKSSPAYGHFFALVPRKRGKEVELFDSESKQGGSIREYLHSGGNTTAPWGGWAARSTSCAAYRR